MSAAGRFVAALVTGLAAGIPILAGIALEWAVIVGGVAWLLGPNWRWGGVEVFWWAFGVQAGLVVLFAVPGVVVHAARTARFLNRDETLAAEIQRLRPTTATAAQRQGGPAASMTDTSLKARVEQLRGDNARLRTENAKLRSQVAALLEQLRAISTVRSVDA